MICEERARRVVAQPPEERRSDGAAREDRGRENCDVGRVSWALEDGRQSIAERDLGHIGEEPERQHREEGQPNLAGGQGVETRADREARLRGRALSRRGYQAGRTPSNWAGGAGMARRPEPTPAPAVAASKAAAMITSLVAWTRA